MPATANRDANAISVGPGLLYVAKIGSAEPPALTALDPSTWDAAWTELGYTDAGSEFQIQPSTNDINVAEETDPVASQTGTTATTLTTNLAQITAFNLAVAFGGGTIVSTAGQPVSFEPPAAGTGGTLMLAWTATDLSEAFVWRKVKPDGSLDINRQSGANKATIPLNLKILAPGGGVPAWKWYGAETTRTGPVVTTLF